MKEAWGKEQEAIGFLQDLTRINTVNPPGNERKAALYVADRMGREGMDVEVIEVSPGREVTLVGKTGCSDGNIIAERLRIPVIAYGPGNDTGHAPNEFIEIADFLDSIKVLTEAIPRLTARAH